MTVTYGLYGSRVYLARFGIPQNLEDLNDHQWIGSKVTNALFLDITSFEMTKTQERGKILIGINSVITRIHLAVENLGIIAAPKDHPTLKQGNLIQILPDIPSPKLDLYSKQFEPLKRIKVFGDYLKIKLNE